MEEKELAKEVFFNLKLFPLKTFIMTELECYSEARNDRRLLCADGTLTKGWEWTGCVDHGSLRVQCPKGHSPCNSLSLKSNGKEFVCNTNCKNRGGNRDCNLKFSNN